MDLMRLRVLGGVGQGLADNLQKGRRDTRVLGKRSLYINLHAHQAKGMNDIAKLLRRLAVAAPAQVVGDLAQQRIDLLERLVVKATLLQIAMEDGQALTDYIVHAGAHAQVGSIVGDLFDLFDLRLKFLARKLEQSIGMRQAVMGMCVLRHVQADDSLQGATRNHNGIAHKQANLGGRNLDHRARLAKAIQVDSNAVFAALGHLSTEPSKAVPRVAHIVQVGGHVKLNEVFAHAAVHEQRTAPRV